MRTYTPLRRAVAALISTAAVIAAFAANPAFAQLCPYNSTQATCACPTSGGGTTCFSGQLYRSTDGSCQNDPRVSAGCTVSQQFNCGTVACQCAAGTTLCPSSGVCVTNRSCPSGTTWDVCTDTCGTPNVLLSPGWIQSGFIKVSGDVTSTAGDLYLANGKAIRVDGSGATSLNVGNWGGGTFNFSVNGVGSNLCLGGTCRTAWPSTTDFNPTYINTTGDTMTGDLTLSGATTDLFVGGNVGVGTTTPSAKLDVVGTTRTTGFQLTTGASAGMVLTSDASGNGTWQTLNAVNGSGTVNALPKFSAATTLTDSIISDDGATATVGGNMDFGSNGGYVGNGNAWFGRVNTLSGAIAGSFAAGEFNTVTSSRAIALGGNSQASGAGNVAIGNYAIASNAGGFGSYAFGNSVTASGSGSMVLGLGASSVSPLNNTIANSLMVGFGATTPTLFVGPGGASGSVGIGTTSPAAKLDVAGTARMTGFQLTTSPVAGRILTSDASGNGTWQAPGGVTSLTAGADISVSSSTGAVTVGDVSTLQTVTNRGATTTNAINVGSGSTTYGVSAQGTTGAVSGQTSANNATAGYFNALNGGANNTGVNSQGSYTGVFGASAASGNAGVVGQGGYYGGKFTGNQYGIHGSCTPASCTGIYGNGTAYAVYGDTGASASGIGVYGTGKNGGLYGLSTGAGHGVYGQSPSGYGVYGYSTGSGYGLYGAAPSGAAAIYGTSNTGHGVIGSSSSGYGGIFSSTSSTGIAVSTSSGTYALNASNTSGTYGVYATAPNTAVYGSGTYYGVAGTGNTGVQGVSYAANGNGGSFVGYGSGSFGMYTSGVGYGVYSAGGKNYFSDYVGIGTQNPYYNLHVEAFSLGGYFHNSYRGSYAFLPNSGYGITAYGPDGGGYFYNLANGITTNVATGWGIDTSGSIYSNGWIHTLGDLDAPNNVWGSAYGWVYCGAGGDCACPNGYFVTNVWNSGQYIYCRKP